MDKLLRKMIIALAVVLLFGMLYLAINFIPAQIDRLNQQEEEEKAPEISIDDFAKVELKVGTVLESAPVEGAKKLLVSKIRIGNEVRQIVSGIAEYYKPEEIIGKQVVVVTNLKPVKLRGVLSEGMILCASKGDKLCIVSPNGDMEDGAEVR